MKLTFTEDIITPNTLRNLIPAASRGVNATIRQYRRKDGTKVLEFEIPGHSFSTSDEDIIKTEMEKIGFRTFEGRS